MNRKPYNLRGLFFQHVGQTSPSPIALEIEKGDGVFLYTADRCYIDLVSGVSVSNVGHNNREVVEAVKNQADNYFHLMVYGEMIQSPQVLHATLLTSILPDSLDCVFYVNSGSEANEGAMKLAKRLTGRTEIISCKNSYHGSTQGALSVMGSEKFKSSFRPLIPDIREISFNSMEDISSISCRTACVIVEPVQGEAGIIEPKAGYLNALRARCDQVGAILVFDEVQTGFGRTGKMFAFQKYGVVPDILTLAKALGGGMPLGAFVSSKEKISALMSNPPLGHITTFGGHPVCCAAALASLKILMREGWISDVERKSVLFEKGLLDHKLVKEIRKSGLMMAVDLGKEEYANKIIPLLIEEGIISDYFLFNPTSFRIAPPLCISDKEIELAVFGIRRALDRLLVD